MKGSDILLSIFIILIFVALQLFNILAIGIKNVQDNWTLYRCNPMVAPFAAIFGKDPSQNFDYCIKNMNTNFMPSLLGPLTSLVGNITDMGSANSNTVKSLITVSASTNSGILGMVDDGVAIVLNIFLVFQTVIIKIKDTFAKVIGIIVSITYILGGLELTALNVWNGPVGGVTRFFASIV